MYQVSVLSPLLEDVGPAPITKRMSGPPPSHHTPQPPLPLALPGVMGMWPPGGPGVRRLG